MPLEENPYLVPHLKALISGQKSHKDTGLHSVILVQLPCKSHYGLTWKSNTLLQYYFATDFALSLSQNKSKSLRIHPDPPDHDKKQFFNKIILANIEFGMPSPDFRS